MEIGYRTEVYNSGERDVEEVMLYEIWELGNLDILDTVLHKYIRGTYLENDINILISEIESDNKKYFIDKNNIKNIIHKIIEIINIKTGTEIKYCLWLVSDKETAKTYYGNENITDADIYQYETSSIILSNLGKEGTLYGYESNPNERRLQ